MWSASYFLKHKLKIKKETGECELIFVNWFSHKCCFPGGSWAASKNDGRTYDGCWTETKTCEEASPR